VQRHSFQSAAVTSCQQVRLTFCLFDVRWAKHHVHRDGRAHDLPHWHPRFRQSLSSSRILPALIIFTSSCVFGVFSIPT